MRPLFLSVTPLLFAITSFASSPDTSITATSGGAKRQAQYALSLRLANESNEADGLFGPVTYGLIGNVTDESGLALDATFIRMHEPDMAPLNSFLDEAQLTVSFPATEALSFAATLWKNRMMDMYTTLGGLEIEQAFEPVSMNLGLYAGSASRFEVQGRFLGAGLEVGAEFGKLEVAIAHVAGLIHLPTDRSSLGVGKYHKTGLEAEIGLNSSESFPVRSTLSIERRFFDFGSGGPASEPIDTYIVVIGFELGLISSSH